MPDFTAVIFDMDGVLIDSEPRHIAAFEEVFHELLEGQPHGLDLPSYIGRSDRAVWLDFIDRHAPGHPLETLTTIKQDRLLEIIRREEPIFHGVPELVRALAAHYRLAVASGSVHAVIRTVLAMKGLAPHFAAVASVEDVARSKPAPDVFLRAAELLGVAPDRCCVIEDSAAGVEAGRAAGMTVIAITNSLPAARLAAAHHVVDSYDAIARLLLPAAPAGALHPRQESR